MMDKSLEFLEETVCSCWRSISNRRQIEKQSSVPGFRERLDCLSHEGKDVSESLFSPVVARR